MDILGKVVAIIDETRLLLELHSPVSVERTLTVFACAKLPALRDVGLEEIYIPKGDVRVLAGQGQDYYLAERFQAEKIEKRRKPSNLTLNPLGQFLGEEVEVVTKGSWSASFDKKQILGIDTPKEIQVGDAVGIK